MTNKVIFIILFLIVIGIVGFVAFDQLSTIRIRNYSVNYTENIVPVLNPSESFYVTVNETSETPYLHLIQNSSWQWKVLTFVGITGNVTIVTTPSTTYHFPINETTAGYLDGWIPYRQALQMNIDDLTVKGIISNLDKLLIIDIAKGNSTIYHWNPYAN